MKKLSRIMTLLLFVCCIAAIFSSCNNRYKLTIDDPHGFIIEKLNKRYTAGDLVTVKTTILYDANLVVYLDGIALDSGMAISTEGVYSHWEYYFIMPTHDAVLSFETYDGFLE